MLVGRRGLDTPGAAELLQALRAAGAEAEVEAVDVTDAGEVAALVARVHRPDRPLVGVVHAAMVLEDVPVPLLDAESFERVFGPKARGAWNLHHATLDCPLELFVVFSSAAALVGNIGQANYVAANRFVDGLAALRRTRGLPALAVSWGMIGEVGYVARNASIARHLESRGMLPFTPDQALDALEALLGWGTPTAGLLRMDWSRWLLSGDAAIDANPLFEHLRSELVAEGGEGADADGGSRSAPLVERLHAQIARVLGLPIARLDPEESLADAGLDSLLSAEIATWIRREVGVEVSVMALMKGPSVTQLAATIEEQVGGPTGEQGPGRLGWTTCVRPVERPRLRLICVPFLGASAEAYAPLAEALDGVEVHLVNLPGGAGRLDEPPVPRMEPLVEAIAEGVRPLLDRPFAIHGHSMGSRVAYELALRLEREGQSPAALCVSSLQAPGDPVMWGSWDRWSDASLDQVSDAMILQEIRRHFLPEGVAANPRAVEEAMPGIRASLLLSVRYEADPQAQVRCPLHAFVGAEDAIVPAKDMERWRERTAGPFTTATLPGGHLYLVEHPRALAAQLSLALHPDAPAESGGRDDD